MRRSQGKIKMNHSKSCIKPLPHKETLRGKKRWEKIGKTKFESFRNGKMFFFLLNTLLMTLMHMTGLVKNEEQ